jgi:hypothetical protein
VSSEDAMTADWSRLAGHLTVASFEPVFERAAIRI